MSEKREATGSPVVKSMFALDYPVKNLWVDFAIPHVDNASVVWKGQVAFVIDANGDPWQTDGLSFDTPWYHCASCEERLSISAKFCPKCGTALDWEHLERDPEAERAFDADARARIEDAALDTGDAQASPPVPASDVANTDAGGGV